MEDYKIPSPWKILGGGILIILGLTVLGWGIRLFVLPGEAVVGVAERVADPDKIIADGHWFAETWADIQSTESKISAQKDQVKSDSETLKESKADPNSLNLYQASQALNTEKAQLTGLKSYLAQKVQDYDAKSENEKGNWKIMTVNVPHHVTLSNDGESVTND